MKQRRFGLGVISDDASVYMFHDVKELDFDPGGSRFSVVIDGSRTTGYLKTLEITA